MQSSLRSHAVQQMLESRRADPQVRNEQASAGLRDLLQRSTSRRELVIQDQHCVLFGNVEYVARTRINRQSKDFR